ncbi:class I adenylate-forming enzyme family protein [Ottowia thiooxydans]|uniref:Long-chain acyl-CoA synthetase n=1 Tax=Ottowia thiooxydans TaxID=219182 RepID=A0ABV2QBC6_9BURK
MSASRLLPDIPASVVHLLQDAARDYPQHWAIRFEGSRLRYAEYAGLIGALANELKLRVAPGERVALLMQNSLDLAIATFAIHALRAQVVALNPGYSERELKAMLDDASPCLLLADDSVRAELLVLCPSMAESQIIRTGNGCGFLRLLESQQPLPDELPNHSHLATLQYTGGTTGVPKGVNITHGHLAANLVQREAWLPTLRGEEVMFCPMPLFHVSAVAMCLHLSVFAASELVVQRRFDAKAAVQTLAQEGVTLMSGAPAIFYDLLRQPDLERVRNGKLRACYSGAASLPERTLVEFRRLTGCPIYEGYGQSEAGPCLTYNPVHRDCKPGSVGLPVLGSELRIVDADGCELPAGSVGEICVRGPHVMAGYRNRPELTAQVLRDGWLHTGDLATKDEDGYVFIRGRHQETINVGGFKVYPIEVEQVLRECESVGECGAFGVIDERLGAVVHAWVTPAPGHLLDAEELRTYCASRLAHYKVPKRIGITTALPRTPIGKLARKELKPVGP